MKSSEKALNRIEKRQAALVGEIEKLSKLEELWPIKASKVPAEPESGFTRVLMVAQHPFQGRETQFFFSSGKDGGCL